MEISEKNNNDKNKENNTETNLPEIDLKIRLYMWLYTIPFFVKFILLITLIFYFINLFFPFITFYLANAPLYTIFQFQLWRLFTNVFLTTSSLDILFALFSWVTDASNLEKSMGSFKYMIIFFINSFLTQIILSFILIIYSFILDDNEILKQKVDLDYVENKGLCPIVMTDLTDICLSHPESLVSIIFIPCKIKARYYPIILFFIYILYRRMKVFFSVSSGIIYGFIYHYYLKNKFQIFDDFIFKLENFIGIKWILKINGFISINNITVFDINNGNNDNNNDNDNNNNDNNNKVNIEDSVNSDDSSTQLPIFNNEKGKLNEKEKDNCKNNTNQNN